MWRTVLVNSIFEQHVASAHTNRMKAMNGNSHGKYNERDIVIGTRILHYSRLFLILSLTNFAWMFHHMTTLPHIEHVKMRLKSRGWNESIRELQPTYYVNSTLLVNGYQSSCRQRNANTKLHALSSESRKLMSDENSTEPSLDIP